MGVHESHVDRILKQTGGIRVSDGYCERNFLSESRINATTLQKRDGDLRMRLVDGDDVGQDRVRRTISRDASYSYGKFIPWNENELAGGQSAEMPHILTESLSHNPI